MLNLPRYTGTCFLQFRLSQVCLVCLVVAAVQAEGVGNLRSESLTNATTISPAPATNESYTNWTEKFLTCEEKLQDLEKSLIPEEIPWWSYLWRITASVFLILMSGLFSGLTLGLCGLDISQLRIIIDADPESQDAKNAKKNLSTS